MIKNEKRGFTLIELLVVVLIIGILASIALPQYRKAVQKARFAQMDVGIQAAKQNIAAFLLANGMPNGNVYFTGHDRVGDVEMPGECNQAGSLLCEGAHMSWGAGCIKSDIKKSSPGEGSARCQIVIFMKGTWLKENAGLELTLDEGSGTWYISAIREPQKVLCEWLKERKYPAQTTDCSTVGVELEPFG